MEKKEFGISKIEKSPDIPSLVAKQITDRIAEGTLKPGDKLPSEHEMTELFGISRISLREAMKLLEARGYIESRDRRGKYVRSMVENMRAPLEALLSVDYERIWELVYVRRIIEAEAAYLAATNATPDHIQEMKDLSRRAQAIGVETLLDTKEGGVIYSRFFDILADATRNTVFVHLRKTITTTLREAFPYSRKKLATVPGSSYALISQLTKIAEAIGRRDAEAARLATIEHIDYIEKSLKKTMEQGK